MAFSLADVNKTIEELLQRELKSDQVHIAFDQPKREWSARVSKPTVNMFMYDLRENVALRQHAWEAYQPATPNSNPFKANHFAEFKRSPFRLDCYYMLTCWVNGNIQDELSLLTQCMAILFRYPIWFVPQADRPEMDVSPWLVGSVKEQPYDIQAKLANHDKLTNPAEVWSALDNEMRPCISYVVTVAIDPWQPVEYPIVTEREIRMQEKPREPIAPAKAVNTQTRPIYQSYEIGGRIFRREKNGKGKEELQPRPETTVTLAGTGLSATTDEFGRFKFGPLQAGRYTLLVEVEGDKPTQKEIVIPKPRGADYDIEI